MHEEQSVGNTEHVSHGDVQVTHEPENGIRGDKQVKQYEVEPEHVTQGERHATQLVPVLGVVVNPLGQLAAADDWQVFELVNLYPAGQEVQLFIVPWHSRHVERQAVQTVVSVIV